MGLFFKEKKANLNFCVSQALSVATTLLESHITKSQDTLTNTSDPQRYYLQAEVYDTPAQQPNFRSRVRFLRDKTDLKGELRGPTLPWHPEGRLCPGGGRARPSPAGLPLLDPCPAVIEALPIMPSPLACQPEHSYPQHRARLERVSRADTETAKPNFASPSGKPLRVKRGCLVLPCEETICLPNSTP